MENPLWPSLLQLHFLIKDLNDSLWQSLLQYCTSSKSIWKSLCDKCNLPRVRRTWEFKVLFGSYRMYIHFHFLFFCTYFLFLKFCTYFLFLNHFMFGTNFLVFFFFLSLYILQKCYYIHFQLKRKRQEGVFILVKMKNTQTLHIFLS